jgi:hypothetical protein
MIGFTGSGGAKDDDIVFFRDIGAACKLDNLFPVQFTVGTLFNILNTGA